jgi:hypothetical protein
VDAELALSLERGACHGAVCGGPRRKGKLHPFARGCELSLSAPALLEAQNPSPSGVPEDFPE